MLFKLSNLNSNLALTLGYLNPALNNSAQGFFPMERAGLLGKRKALWTKLFSSITMFPTAGNALEISLLERKIHF